MLHACTHTHAACMYIYDISRIVTGSPAALIMEYPPYGCLHTYLLIKRRARISNSTMLWGGLKLTSDEPLVIKALPETERPHLSMLLDSYDSRSRAFNIPLNESFSELDELLFALQVGFAMEFLIDQGVSM